MGKLSELINSMIDTKLFSGVIFSPRFSDYRWAESLNEDNPDLEAEVMAILEQNQVSDSSGIEIADAKAEQKQDEINRLVDTFKAGNVGELNRFTSNQMGNLRGFVNNPAQFMMSAVFNKLAKGAGIIALALTIFEAVKWIISELLKPGRLLDIRFKRDIRNEIIAFRRREEQQKLKQGFSSYIITSQPRLRGGQGQVTNTLDITRRGNFPDNIGANPIQIQASGVSMSKSMGRRHSRGPGA